MTAQDAARSIIMRLGEFPEEQNQGGKDAVDRLAETADKIQGKSAREIYASLDSAGKRQYFADYILPRMLKAACALAVLCFLLWNFVVKPKDTTALYVVMPGETLEAEGKAALQEKLEHLIGDGDSGNNQKQIILDDSKDPQNGGLEQTETLLFNRQVDVVIAERSIFEQLAADGDFVDLQTILSREELEIFREDLVMAAGYDDPDEQDVNADGVGKGEPEAYGLSLSDCAAFRELAPESVEPVFGIAANSQHMANALAFVKSMSQKPR